MIKYLNKEINICVNFAEKYLDDIEKFVLENIDILYQKPRFPPRICPRVLHDFSFVSELEIYICILISYIYIYNTNIHYDIYLDDIYLYDIYFLKIPSV